MDKIKKLLTKANPRGLVAATALLLAVVTLLQDLRLLLFNLLLVLIVFRLVCCNFRGIFTKFALLCPLAVFLALAAALSTPGHEIAGIRLGGFALMLSAEGIRKALRLLLRMFNSLGIIFLLLELVGARRFLHTLRLFKVPALFIRLAEFILRYFGLVAAELTRMQLARKARCFSFRQSIIRTNVMRTLTQLIGVLFLRSLSRGERIYLAMLSRGYAGDFQTYIPEQKTEGTNTLGIGVVLYSMLLLLLDKGWVRW